MTIAEIVSIVFRLINFGVLVAIGVVAVKRYLLPLIQDQLRVRATETDQLRALKKLLVIDMSDIERALVDEHHEIARLKEKLAQWRARIDYEKNVIAKQREERMSSEHARAERQMEKIKQVYLFTNALPRAVENATAQLGKKFSSAHVQESYVHELTTRIKGL